MNKRQIQGLRTRAKNLRDMALWLTAMADDAEGLEPSPKRKPRRREVEQRTPVGGGRRGMQYELIDDRWYDKINEKFVRRGSALHRTLSKGDPVG